MAQAAIDELGSASDRPGALVAVDLCSGSGALALSIAVEVTDVHVHAVELSGDAVLWLQRNVDELGLRDRVTVHHDDAALAPEGLDGQASVVVCNPPYVPIGATIRDPEVIAHDPPLALWGGADGLDVVRRVDRQRRAAAASRRPARGRARRRAGRVAPRAAAAALERRRRWPAWTDVEDHPDLNGLPRFTSARRRRRAGATARAAAS